VNLLTFFCFSSIVKKLTEKIDPYFVPLTVGVIANLPVFLAKVDAPQ
jgi:hypothetical protein